MKDQDDVDHMVLKELLSESCFITLDQECQTWFCHSLKGYNWLKYFFHFFRNEIESIKQDNKKLIHIFYFEKNRWQI